MEKIESVEDAIANIELLFPPDSEYKDTREIGRSLLQEAIGNVGFTWRDYPDDVLIEFAKLCVIEDNSR